MSSFQKLLQQDPLEHFSIAHLASQKYAEVEPEFVQQFSNELQTKWHIINEEAEVNELKFKNCCIFPIITDGWEEFIKKTNLPTNAQVMFSFYGKSIFAIAGFRELNDPISYPKFHSRSLDPNETFYFDVAMLDFNLNQQKKYIPRKFGDFLKQNGFELLYCSTDLGQFQIFEVLLKNDKDYTVELGLDWNNFCQANNFKTGALRFKFTKNFTTASCHVYQLPTTASSYTSV